MVLGNSGTPTAAEVTAAVETVVGLLTTALIVVLPLPVVLVLAARSALVVIGVAPTEVPEMGVTMVSVPVPIVVCGGVHTGVAVVEMLEAIPPVPVVVCGGVHTGVAVVEMLEGILVVVLSDETVVVSVATVVPSTLVPRDDITALE